MSSLKQDKQTALEELTKRLAFGSGESLGFSASKRGIIIPVSNEVKHRAVGARLRQRSTTRLQLFRNPFQGLAQLAATNILRGVAQEAVPEPPDTRYVQMRSGPFKGKWVRVHEKVNLWSEGYYQFVVSSNISAIAYNPKLKELQIEFRGGSVYTYKNVTVNQWRGFNRAMSKGKWFWRNVRPFINRYPYKRVRFGRIETNRMPKSLKQRGYKT